MTALRLRDFRGYRQVSLHPPEGVTIGAGAGQNGAGKTNLLEAVHLCCRLKPPHLFLIGK